MQNKVLLFGCSILLLCLSGCSKDSVPENEMPVLDTGEATAVSRKTATISGSVIASTGSEVRNCGFLYSTVSTLPESESKMVSIVLQSGQNIYTTTLTGLTPNTKYYYCLYASSGYTTIRSSVREFTTAADGVPALEASVLISSSETSLTVASRISDDGGSELQKFGIAYRINGTADAEKMMEATQKESDGRYTFTITGLAAETAYDVRAFATNSKGTGYGEAITLTTSAPELPLLQIETQVPGSASVAVSAKLTNENDLSSGITEVGFCWSKEKEEPTTADDKLIANLNDGIFNAVIQNLTPETKYYIRAYAVNKKTKTGYSKTISVTTTKSAEPKLAATTVLSVDETSALMQSQVMDNGGHDIIKIGFAYKTENTPETLKEVPVSELKEDGSFSFALTGLSPVTAYEVRAYAVNSVGTGYSESCSVTTLEQKAPQVTLEVGTPSGVSVAVTGVIQSVGGETSTIREVGFCWSNSNAMPTIADSKMQSSLEGVTFSSFITGLKSETKYYIRAFAVNEARVGYSDVVAVTTGESNVPSEDDIVSPDKKD